MRLKTLRLTLMGGAVAALLAACGGGGGDSAATPASVQLTGVAATGLALANSTVAVKCASGTGSATTNDSGSYTVTVVDGAMPCLIKVTGTADGVEVTLHSVAEAGTTSGSTTSATANVTPLTEMIVAHLAGAVPSTLFESFGSGSTLTSAELSAATTTVLTALKDATGIDLGTTDPFKSTLIPATATTAGNDYDDALEALQLKVPLAALPLVVTQIANASTASGSSAPITLAEVMTSVNAGSPANCPSVLSGRYRMIDYRGATQVVQIDFSRNLVIDGADEIAITPSDTACEFSVAGDLSNTLAFGPSGVGALRDAETTGYVFPVQSHPLSSFTGEWNYVESGTEEDNTPVHFVGKFTFNADGSGSACDYYSETTGLSSTCTADDETPSITATSDGGVALSYGNTPGLVYGYLAPNGSFYAFGTTNPEGTNGPGTMRSHFVMHKPSTLTVPALNTVTKYWDFIIDGTGTTFGADQNTVTGISGSTYQRTRASDGRVDTMRVNDPLAGYRYREAATGIRASHVIPMPGLGMGVFINAGGDPHYHGISVTRR